MSRIPFRLTGRLPLKLHRPSTLAVRTRPLHNASTKKYSEGTDSDFRLELPAGINEDEIEEIIPLGTQSAAGQGVVETEYPPYEYNPYPDLRLPRGVQTLYLKPLKRKPTHGIPCCDLQLRSYEVRNVEFFADFAMRAAYYLNLPALGPIPLPRMIQRWTVPRGHFVHKKSQENFERITLRRMIQIQDGHEDSVNLWLAFLRKHAYYGVGMKANIWRYSSLDVSKELDSQVKEFAPSLDPLWAQLARRKGTKDSKDTVELLSSDKYRAFVDRKPPIAR